VPHARRSAYRSAWSALLTPLRARMTGSWVGRPGGHMGLRRGRRDRPPCLAMCRLPSNPSLPRSGASPPRSLLGPWGWSLRPPNVGWGALRCSEASSTAD
jgi:hypothetical protein